MATLALAAVGAAAGSALLPAGISVLGATLTGAAIGSQIGALAGSFIDQALFGASGHSRALRGPRLDDLRITGSSEGAPIPRLYGRARIGGTIVWATNLEEETVTTEAGGGGKGVGGGSSSGATEAVEYRYYANLAVALCEGPITRVGRMWADGKELDIATFTHRLHLGSEDQLSDSLISAKEGAGNAPAYRGVAYIVFERLALARFGNRIPQLSFEVVRSVDPFEQQIRGVTLIPGAGEFAYGPSEYARAIGLGATEPENVHTRQGGSNWTVALDQLQATLPNVANVNLFVAWFGDDLRAGQCTIRPKVEIGAKETIPLAWSVAGLARSGAAQVSQTGGRPAYGGTPSDASVVAAIRDMKDRGLAVTLNPFLLMDVPAGNTRPDPYTGASSQPAYPWRGRITLDPAPGQPGSPDKTAAASAQIAGFIGTALPSHFALSGETVVYTGPAEWSYRRLVLHNAYLAKAAGGVEAFLIGSELPGLTTARSGPSAYPFVAALVALAADVRTVLGPGTRISYAADWSEYFGHQPADGSGDVYFHLDPLWASSSIDAVGIDVYWPLADWRDGRDHLDWQAGHRSTADLTYLKSNIFGGEGYDWYYASVADRAAQVRTPITDGAGKPWVFRFKDIRGWWQNAHHDRPGGIESATPTAWVPQSKPIWLTELGCPAVDKGANQPNVFVDPKSAESALPYFSTGVRDDTIQRRYLEAFHQFLDPAHEGYVAGSNPLSAVYGGPMVPLDRIGVYTWDARPYPAFPQNAEAWGDAANWHLGHWINGRLSNAPVDRIVGQLLADYGFEDFDASGLSGTIAGLVVDRIMPAREALQPLEVSHFIDAFESDGLIRLVNRGAGEVTATLDESDLVEAKAEGPLYDLVRAQETELPAAAKVSFIGAEGDYARAVGEARRLTGATGRIATAELPIVMEQAQAGAIAESWLFESWQARERASFALPPSRLALEPADLVEIDLGGRTRLMRLTEIADAGRREIAALAIDPAVYEPVDAAPREIAAGAIALYGAPLLHFLDLPLLTGDEPDAAGYVAAFLQPWPGAISVYRSPGSTGFVLAGAARVRATLGVTTSALPAGPTSRWDHANTVTVTLSAGELSSKTQLEVLEGANAAAIQGAGGAWEVLQFLDAELIGERAYRLSGLLRGQVGTEGAMAGPLPAGAPFVLLSSAVTRIDLAAADIGRAFTWKAGPANRPIDSASYATITHAFAGIGLRPLSPVHIRGHRTGGDLVLSWVRRTRKGGDSWEAVEVPFAEDSERYEVDILDGATVKRTLQSSTPTVTYTAAQQTADWGAPPPTVQVRVYQMSAVLGRGMGRTATV
jgi:hypothetical protein